MSGRGKGKTTKKAVSKSAKAGLQVRWQCTTSLTWNNAALCAALALLKLYKIALFVVQSGLTTKSELAFVNSSSLLQFPVGRIARYLKKGKVGPYGNLIEQARVR
jgi:hypothetical protein